MAEEVVDEFAREMAHASITAWSGLVAIIAFRLRRMGATDAGLDLLDDVDRMLSDAIPSAPLYELLADRVASIRERLEDRDRTEDTSSSGG